MNVRRLEATELPRLERAAGEFFASSRFLDGFDLERFVATWEAVYEAASGVILVAEDGDEIAGAIGGVASMDPNTGVMTATEFFWFVREPYRRTGVGIELYHRFEAWASAMGCRQIRMAYLVDLMPEVVKEVYGSLGFVPVEVMYSKELGG